MERSFPELALQLQKGSVRACRGWILEESFKPFHEEFVLFVAMHASVVSLTSDSSRFSDIRPAKRQRTHGAWGCLWSFLIWKKLNSVWKTCVIHLLFPCALPERCVATDPSLQVTGGGLAPSSLPCYCPFATGCFFLSVALLRWGIKGILKTVEEKRQKSFRRIYHFHFWLHSSESKNCKTRKNSTEGVIGPAPSGRPMAIVYLYLSRNSRLGQGTIYLVHQISKHRTCGCHTQYHGLYCSPHFIQTWPCLIIIFFCFLHSQKRTSYHRNHGSNSEIFFPFFAKSNFKRKRQKVSFSPMTVIKGLSPLTKEKNGWDSWPS